MCQGRGEDGASLLSHPLSWECPGSSRLSEPSRVAWLSVFTWSSQLALGGCAGSPGSRPESWARWVPPAPPRSPEACVEERGSGSCLLPLRFPVNVDY